MQEVSRINRFKRNGYDQTFDIKSYRDHSPVAHDESERGTNHNGPGICVTLVPDYVQDLGEAHVRSPVLGNWCWLTGDGERPSLDGAGEFPPAE
jgi:hypothetical protein